MTQTQRLTLVEQQPRGFFPFRKKAPAPDMTLVGQYVLRVADACIEQLRCLPEEYQVKCWELVEEVLKDSERKRRMYEEDQR